MSVKELQEYTYFSRYARYNKEQKRRETWGEAVDRVMNMHLTRYPEAAEEIEWVRPLMKEKRLLGSQRALQFGGDPILKKHARLYNCLDRHTPFITKEGIKTFCDFEDGDKTIVLTHKGNWKNATVRCYGKDFLYPVNIRRGRANHTVWATKNHRWILNNGEFVEGVDEGFDLLKAPDIFSEFDYDLASPEERLYWAYGLVFGDGTVVQGPNGEPQYSMIRLCGNNRKYAYRFKELGFKSNTNHSLKGDIYAYTGTYLKTSPDPTIDDPKLIRAFTRGYLDADGTKNRNCRKNQKYPSKNLFSVIQATGQKHIDFIRKCFPIAGIYIVSEKELTGQKTNYGTRPYTVMFRIFNYLGNTSTHFRVINNPEQEEPTYKSVWCLEVEDDQSFVLPFGLTTGNCTFSYCDRIRFFQETLWLLLCGSGVGVSVQKHHVEKLPNLHKINKSDRIFVVPDSIEGWADSLGVLLSCYLPHPEFKDWLGHRVIFDFSEIRPAGSSLSSGVGKAPGPDPLKKALSKVQDLLNECIDRNQKRLRPIDAYDVVMHASDAVLSGGVRRCIAKGSRVITKEDGYKKIEDINKGDLVSTIDGWQPVENIFKQGVQKTIRVVHQDGFLDCTPNHRIAVLTSISGDLVWKTADSLRRGNRLMFVEQAIQSNIVPIEFIKIEDLNQEVETYDLEVKNNHCFICEGILVHNSATIALFSPDDEEMMSAKTGNWFYENPQRGRSNNSVLLIKDEVNKDQFLRIMQYIKEFGEPGFVFAENKEMLVNPCCEISGYAYDEDGNSGFQCCNLTEINGKKIRCKEDFALAARGAAILGTLQAGYADFEYLGEVTEKIVKREALLGVSITGMMDSPDIIFDQEIQKEMAKLVVKTNEWMAKKIGINPAARTTCIKPSGCRPLNALTTTSKGILTLGEIMENHDIRNEWSDFQGDTSTHGGAITKTFVNGEKDVVKIRLKYGVELVCTPNHPWFVKQSKKADVNHWVQAQNLKSGDVLDVNLTAYRNEKHVSFKHRLETYDNISQPETMNNDLSWLFGYLWSDENVKLNKYHLQFTDEYSQYLEKVQKIVKKHFNIDSKLVRLDDKYALEFEDNFLWHWLLKNDICNINYLPRIVRESSYDDILSFIAGMVDSDGRVDNTIVFSTANEKFADHFQQVAMSVGLGFSRSLDGNMWFLDLSAHVDQESFNILSKNSEKISSLPSGYTWKHEAMSSNVGIFGKVHSVEPIGIQPTFDIETEQSWFYAGAVKSHNTTSCILGSSSGVHPHHAKRYFRRVQGNALEPVLQHFKKINPDAVGDSVWSANETDQIITFCVEVPDGSKTKNQVPGLDLLEYVKLTQQNWVLYGKRKELCTQPWLTHNVSNTINIKPEEWDEVTDYIYKNRKWFAGISLIPQSGDLDYPQAPMTTVRTSREILHMYGDGALFASGLIVDGLHAFGDLWKACDAALGLGEPLNEPKKPGNGEIYINDHREWEQLHAEWESKKDWIRRVSQFAEKYCNNDVRKCTYLLKDTNNWKLWLDLKREYKNVDYTTLFEDEDHTKPMEEIACAGGACLLSI